MSDKLILIVEDDVEMRDLLSLLLERNHYRTAVARTGEAALLALAEQVPDLMLLDLMLPRLSGWDVLRQSRARHPLLPIIMVSGRSEPVDRVVGLELGADDYVVKPFHSQELLARIASVLRRSRRLDQNELTLETPELLPQRDREVTPPPIRNLPASQRSTPPKRRR